MSPSRASSPSPNAQVQTPSKSSRVPLAPKPVRSTSHVSLTCVSVPSSTSTSTTRAPSTSGASTPTPSRSASSASHLSARASLTTTPAASQLLSPSPRRRTVSTSTSSHTIGSTSAPGSGAGAGLGAAGAGNGRSSRASSLYDGRTGSFSPRSPSPSVASVSLSMPAAVGDSGQEGHGGDGLSLSSRSTSMKGKERAISTHDGLGEGSGLAEEEEAADGLEAGMESGGVLGEVVEPGPGTAAEGLRELVRRATVGERDRPVRSRAASIKGELHTLDPPNEDQRVYTKRRYYVLTNAGKPVFSSHEASGDNLTNLMGVAQALISIFAEDDDRIRCINRGRQRIAFVLKSPLYLFAVSDWGEPEHVLRGHLEYIYLQIVSVVSGTQLSRAFQRRSNFDLSRLLEGTETFLHHLIDGCQSDFSYLTSTLQPLRMPPALRDAAAAALMPPAKFKDLLYVLLIAGGHIVTLLRPRKHSIHPSDLHLLLNTLASSAALRSTETWLPICLPKFNAAGFVHAYVSYVLEDVGLVFVSADREAFEDLRGWKETVVAKLEADKNLAKIEAALSQHAYSVSVLGQPGIRHFIYKSRQNVQLTAPVWPAPYDQADSADRKRLVTTYQRLHDAIHARSGQSTALKLVYVRTAHEACLAWITRPFELYLTVEPDMPKGAVVAAANSVARWVQAEETKLFLKDAPVF